jgi:hypothetical protein
MVFGGLIYLSLGIISTFFGPKHIFLLSSCGGSLLVGSAFNYLANSGFESDILVLIIVCSFVLCSLCSFPLMKWRVDKKSREVYVFLWAGTYFGSIFFAILSLFNKNVTP